MRTTDGSCQPMAPRSAVLQAHGWGWAGCAELSGNRVSRNGLSGNAQVGVGRPGVTDRAEHARDVDHRHQRRNLRASLGAQSLRGKWVPHRRHRLRAPQTRTSTAAAAAGGTGRSGLPPGLGASALRLSPHSPRYVRTSSKLRQKHRNSDRPIDESCAAESAQRRIGPPPNHRPSVLRSKSIPTLPAFCLSRRKAARTDSRIFSQDCAAACPPPSRSA